ncbi:MAG: polysaccharide deacetylase family protein [Armatimonadetes bacterium]|nr:polysaccharide deacetylase family protein [Armatimonadota bacterium]
MELAMRYAFHYDLENADLCLKAAPQLARLHRERGVPATFFMLGRVLEQKGTELKAIFGDDPLFDIQSHTYAHQMLRDNKMHGPGVSLDELRREITLGREWVERVFERPCIGIRSGCGFYQGFQGEAERLAIIADCDARYISTDLRGPMDSIPSGLQQAYWYDQEGQPQLLELPGHGWHDNVLKAPGAAAWLALPWPPYVGWGVPRRPPATPEEECAVQTVWIDQARELKLDFLSLVYHPHSIYRMNEDCRTIALLMDALAERDVATTTYTALYREYAAAPTEVPGRTAWQFERPAPAEALF